MELYRVLRVCRSGERICNKADQSRKRRTLFINVSVLFFFFPLPRFPLDAYEERGGKSRRRRRRRCRRRDVCMCTLDEREYIVEACERREEKRKKRMVVVKEEK